MQLDYTQICSATCGAAYIEKKDGILFHRLPKSRKEFIWMPGHS